MDKPRSVHQAISLIWITIAISILTVLIDKWAGHISEGEFMFNLILYGFFCMFPYKLNNKSNAARYVYGVIVGLSLLVILGGVTATASALTNFVSLILMLVQVFIVYRLFQSESSEWFHSSELDLH